MTACTCGDCLPCELAEMRRRRARRRVRAVPFVVFREGAKPEQIDAALERARAEHAA